METLRCDQNCMDECHRYSLYDYWLALLWLLQRIVLAEMRKRFFHDGIAFLS